MKNGWIRGMAAAVVAAAVLGSACVAHAGDNKLEKKATKEGQQYYDGMISAVDFKANTVTVKKENNAGTMTFTSGADAKFYVREKKTGAALTDFKVGDKVEVWYTVDAGTPTLHTFGEKDAHAAHKEKRAEKGK